MFSFEKKKVQLILFRRQILHQTTIIMTTTFNTVYTLKYANEVLAENLQGAGTSSSTYNTARK